MDFFRTLKSQLGLRPAFRRTHKRSDGHLFITVIAYQLVQTIHRCLGQKGEKASGSLRSILEGQQRVTATFNRKDGRTLTCANGFARRAPTTQDPCGDAQAGLSRCLTGAFLRCARKLSTAPGGAPKPAATEKRSCILLGPGMRGPYWTGHREGGQQDLRCVRPRSCSGKHQEDDRLTSEWAEGNPICRAMRGFLHL